MNKYLGSNADGFASYIRPPNHQIWESRNPAYTPDERDVEKSFPCH